VASKHKKERVYVALNGYRSDDFTPYIYASDDYGSTWNPIAANIPDSPVNVVIEDPENEDLLFAGTDNGLYVSFTRGKSWEVFQNGMPNVAVHDLAIQTKAKHLLIGTHGRSIYKADISHLQNMTQSLMSNNLHVYTLDNKKHSSRWGNSWSSWGKPQTPGLDVVFYSNKADAFAAKIKTTSGITLSETEMNGDRGLNILSYDMAFSKAGKVAYLKKNKSELKEAKNGKTYLPKGKYIVEISGNGANKKVEFEIE